jgi:hypothetical protein
MELKIGIETYIHHTIKKYEVRCHTLKFKLYLNSNLNDICLVLEVVRLKSGNTPWTLGPVYFRPSSQPPSWAEPAHRPSNSPPCNMEELEG